jgi:hypothetical protein
LKSHFTVSQTLGGRIEEGMNGRQDGFIHITPPLDLSRVHLCASPAISLDSEIFLSVSSSPG